ncbi:MAG: FMN-binding protein [Prolixibacteraceae bacterium]|nr:FMN-binding protein [Prolixibacteraceae bacterium]
MKVLKYKILLAVALLGFHEATAFDLQKIFSKEFKTSPSNIELQEFIPEYLAEDETDQFFKLYANKQGEGYVVLAKAKGKNDYFDFFVWYDFEISVKLVKVVSYFSDHGGEISGKKWLSQFIGYSGDELEYGKDVQAISGATISGKAITSKIEELTKKLRNYTEN